MENIWAYIKRMFRETEESSPVRPYVHEELVRTEPEQIVYEQWKNSLDRRRMLNNLSDEYATHQIDAVQVDHAMDFLDTPSMKGFVIHTKTGKYEQQDLVFLFDYLKEKVLQNGYTNYMSDRRIYQRGKGMEMVERHYLKPRTLLQENKKINQRFGNVRIELLYRNDALINLQFSATGYSDHLFKDASDFKDLMSLLTTE